VRLDHLPLGDRLWGRGRVLVDRLLQRRLVGRGGRLGAPTLEHVEHPHPEVLGGRAARVVGSDLIGFAQRGDLRRRVAPAFAHALIVGAPDHPDQRQQHRHRDAEQHRAAPRLHAVRIGRRKAVLAAQRRGVDAVDHLSGAALVSQRRIAGVRSGGVQSSGQWLKRRDSVPEREPFFQRRG